MEKNGRTTWLVWSAGVIMSIITTAIIFMANVVYSNETTRVRENIEIRKEIVYVKDCINDKLELIIKELADLKGDLKVIKSQRD